MVEIERVSSQSLDVEDVNKDKLRSVFPECFSEGKLDIDKLLSLCGEYIDNDFEKYKFEWKGKSECNRIAGKRSTGTLRPCPEDSVNFDSTNNLYIEGDNLEVLKLLQTAYYRKVKMIYIDPPYNTGNDFVYEDDFKDPMAKYKEVTQQTTKSNPETMGRYHTNWLNMMYPRLRLASNLLRDDGVIFISIDDNEVTNLRKLCDEVFGEENFVAQISVVNNIAGRSDSKYIATANEYLLAYAKSWEFSASGLPLTQEQLAEFKYEDEQGKYRIQGLRKRGSGALRTDRPNMFYPIYYDKDRGKITLNENEITTPIIIIPKLSDGQEGRWRWGRDTFLTKMNNLEIRFVSGRNEYDVYEKVYLNTDNEEKTTKMKSYLLDAKYTTDTATTEYKKIMEAKSFESPKAVDLIKDIIRVGNLNTKDIILDFFSGSATTALAVMQLNAEDGGNRKFICVQLPEICDEKSEAYKAGYKNICEIGKERIRRAGKKILQEYTQRHCEERSDEAIQKELTGLPRADALAVTSVDCTDKSTQNNSLDVGFKVFKLDTSNLVKWDSTPTEDTEELQARLSLLNETIKPDRNELDVVYETMLKLGIPLDYPVKEVQVNDKKAYSIGEDCLVLICLDYGQDGITADDMKTMCEDFVPAKIVASEQAFKDDVALSNAHYILKDHNIEMKLL